MMSKLRLSLPERFRWLFFGTLDRSIATISLLVGIASFVLAIWIKYSQPTIVFFYIRDILILVLLVSIIVALTLKILSVESKADRFRSLWSTQLEADHRMVDKFRDYFFKEICRPLAKSQPDLNAYKTNKTYFYQVCHSLLTDTRNVFQDYYNARGYAIGEDLSLTVKLIIARDEAQEIENKAKGDQADILSPKGRYIVSVFRDPYTWEKKLGRREIRQVVYRADDNTAFNEVIIQGKRKFYSNNLKKLSGYINRNDRWDDFYNATLVVPIRYKPGWPNHDDDVSCFGALCVDSENPRDLDLFSNEIPYNILAHAADMLTIMFGHMDIVQLLDV